MLLWIVIIDLMVHPVELLIKPLFYFQGVQSSRKVGLKWIGSTFFIVTNPVLLSQEDNQKQTTMKKRLFLSTILLAIAILLPLKSQAYDFSAVAPSGQTLYYNIVDGNAQVTHQNTSYPYYTTYPTGNLTIPSTVTYNGTTYSVTSIGAGAFESCTGLTGTLTIPNSVTTIGTNAIRGCTGLTSVNIPNSVTTIGYNAFLECTGLTAITIPNSVTSIDAGAFESCTGLTGTLTIPNSVTSINRGAFKNCTRLCDISIPSSVTYIGDNAFYYVKNVSYSGNATGSPWGALTVNGYVDDYFIYADASKTTLTGCCPSVEGAVTIPNSVTTIGQGAFQNCRGLTSITIPSSVTSIKDFAFLLCTGLTSMVVENGNEVYDSRNDCNAIIKTATNSLIFGCKTSIIPYSVTTIQTNAFNGCAGLTSITIPNSVTSINNHAFRECTGLTSITIPNSVTYIGQSAFYKCSGLTSMVVESGNTVYDSRNNCNAIIETATNRLISGCKNSIIPNTVTSIGETAFYFCTDLTSITIPNSVTSIGYYAFALSGLAGTLIVPNSVDTISQSAFGSCTGLTAIIIGNSVSSIGQYAFSGCRGLTEIHSLSNVPPTLGIAAFGGVTSTIPVYIPCGRTSYYAATDGWSQFSNFIEDCGSNGINDMTSAPDNIKIYSRGNTIVIDYSGQQAADSRQSVVVYDIMGRVIKQSADGCQQAAVEIPVTTAGVYMVKVGERPSRKVVVRP